MIRRPPRSTLDRSSAASDVYKRQAIALPNGQSPLTLKFWNYQSFESRSGGCYDGGILEITTNAGSTWAQITSGLLTDPYNGPFGGGNPLGTVNAWCGDPQNWLNSVIDINTYAGKTVQFRFRVGSDTGVGRADGWNLDDVVVKSCQAEAACYWACLLYTSPSPRDRTSSRMPSSA